MAEISLLRPLVYAEMIMATLAGWWFFREVHDRWTVLGVTILITCAIPSISANERDVLQRFGSPSSPEVPADKHEAATPPQVQPFAR